MGREVKEKEVKVGTLKEVLTKDLPKIFKDFGKRLKVEDSILEIPSQVKKTSNTLGYFDLVTDTIMMIFSFLLSGSNAAIEAKLALLGMILFFVYKLEPGFLVWVLPVALPVVALCAAILD